MRVWRELGCVLAWESDDGETHVTLVEDTDVTSHTSPHTRTAVPIAEKLVPVTVSVVPPASDVDVGETLITANGAPSRVGRTRWTPVV